MVDQKVQVDLRTRTVDIEQQETVTRDSVTIKVNAVFYYRIYDPRKTIIEIERYTVATYQIALTSLRNVIGQHNLDEILRARDSINHDVAEIVDKLTEPWGLKVELVEMKDVEIPVSMQRAMAKEAEAIREKRARIIKAEAESEAAEKLLLASKSISQIPLSLELRRMPMITEVGAEQNSTSIIFMATDSVTMAAAAAQRLSDNQPRGEAAADRLAKSV